MLAKIRWTEMEGAVETADSTSSKRAQFVFGLHGSNAMVYPTRRLFQSVPFSASKTEGVPLSLLFTPTREQASRDGDVIVHCSNHAHPSLNLNIDMPT
jgi:hypothetical protein